MVLVSYPWITFLSVSVFNWAIVPVFLHFLCFWLFVPFFVVSNRIHSFCPNPSIPSEAAWSVLCLSARLTCFHSRLNHNLYSLFFLIAKIYRSTSWKTPLHFISYFSGLFLSRDLYIIELMSRFFKLTVYLEKWLHRSIAARKIVWDSLGKRFFPLIFRMQRCNYCTYFSRLSNGLSFRMKLFFFLLLITSALSCAPPIPASFQRDPSPPIIPASPAYSQQQQSNYVPPPPSHDQLGKRWSS